MPLKTYTCLACGAEFQAVSKQSEPSWPEPTCPLCYGKLEEEEETRELEPEL